MTKQRLSNFVIEKLSAPKGNDANYLVWDSDIPGFGIRVGASTKVWLVSYRNRQHKQRKLRLGTYPAINAEKARQLAKIALGEIAGGKDPAALKAEERRREHARTRDLLQRYLTDRKRRKVIAATQEDRALREGMGEKYLGTDISTIDRQAFAKLIDSIGFSRGEGAAGYFRKTARTFLDWCVDHGLVQSNVLAGYRRARQTKAEKLVTQTAARALSAEELGQVWNAADPTTVFGRLVRFLLLTGCRRDEAASLQRSWVDRKAGLINLPAELTKMGRDHTIIITPALEEVLNKCPPMVSPLVFPSVRKSKKFKDSKIKGWSKLMPKLVQACGVNFSLHDLRRSVKTHIRELGYDSDLAGLLVGHARDSFEARYDHSRLLELRREAAEAYAQLVLSAARKAKRAPKGHVVELSANRSIGAAHTGRK
jgi:integrase